MFIRKKSIRGSVWKNVIFQTLFLVSVISSPIITNAENVDEQTRKVAEVVSQAGNLFANSPNTDTTASMVRSITTDAASSEIQDWLNRFGTARVRLDTDKNFSLKNSQFDLLIPLYDRKNNIAFSQWSLHRTDDRTQTNLGFGIRHFASQYMLGANVFGDYDLSRDHARAGIGAEYWRDYLKLGVNGYIGLTGWKDSPNMSHYEERPADGWDIRTQGWLPQFPQLGGKLTYEQYYGKEVALFGKDNRQRNPYAMTAALEYTPVPVVTIIGEQRHGQSGKNDTKLGLDLNYRIGVPWQHQIDAEMVANMRSLSGSRYDLVERNNNIVLEYREKQVISLHSADIVTGYGGERKPLSISVTSTHGLSHIDWSAPALLAAGGKIEQTENDWTVILPTYQANMQKLNTYKVSAVAVDTKGNRSNSSETLVTVQSPTISENKSTLTPVNSTLLADGVSSQELILTIKDEQGQNIETEIADIVLDSGTLKSAKVSGPERKDTGVYAIIVTAGLDEETVKITPKVRDVQFSPVEVIISALIPAQATSLISTDAPAYVSGDDKTVTVTLKDESGRIIKGQAALLTDSTVIIPNAIPKTRNSSWRDNGDGTYQAVYTVTTASDNVQATLQLSHWSSSISSEAYTIRPSSPTEAQSSISTNAQNYASNDEIIMTVTLKDAAGNPINDHAALLTDNTVTVANAVLKSDSTWQNSGNGTYHATYSITASGDNLLATLRLNHWSSYVSSETYTITPSAPSEARSSISTDKHSYASGDDIKVTVTLKDTVGSPIDDQAILLNNNTVRVANASLKSGSSWQASGNGMYHAIYTAESASTDLQAILMLPNWNNKVTSATYVITIVSGSTTVKGSQSLPFYPRTFSVNFIPDKDYIFDSNCLTVNGTLKVANLTPTNVSKWGDTPVNYNTVGTYVWNLTVSNQCGYPVSGSVTTHLYRPDGSAEINNYPINIDGKGA